MNNILSKLNKFNKERIYVLIGTCILYTPIITYFSNNNYKFNKSSPNKGLSYFSYVHLR